MDLKSGNKVKKKWESLGTSGSGNEKIPKLLIYIEDMSDAFLTHSTQLAEMMKGSEISITQRATRSLNLLKQFHLLEVRNNEKKVN